MQLEHASTNGHGHAGRQCAGSGWCQVTNLAALQALVERYRGAKVHKMRLQLKQGDESDLLLGRVESLLK